MRKEIKNTYRYFCKGIVKAPLNSNYDVYIMDYSDYINNMIRTNYSDDTGVFYMLGQYGVR